MPRIGLALSLTLLATLLQCGGDDSTELPVEVGSDTGDEVAVQETPMTPLTVRLVLDHNTMPAGADSSTNVEAQLSGVLHVRNESEEPQSLDFVIPMSHQLEWTLTTDNDVRWKPMFLPPPMPHPDGPPRRTMQLEPGTEAPATNLHGISGFYEEAQGTEDWGPLPAGRYEIVISGIELGTGPLQTPPVTFVVQP